MIDLEKLIKEFLNYSVNENVELYNEFSLQHELGIFLRNNIKGYKIQFEKNISFFGIDDKLIKKEIDIVIFTPDMKEKYAIELKFPCNGQYPEQMYSFVKDIKFIEELKGEGFSKVFTLTLVNDKKFYKGKTKQGIYSYFRNKETLSGKIYKPTGIYKNIKFINIEGTYKIDFKKLDNNFSFYIVQI